MNILAKIAALVVIMASLALSQSEARAAEVSPPQATDDWVSGLYVGVPVFVDALANDTDPQDLPLAIDWVGSPSASNAITVTIVDGGLHVVLHKNAAGRTINFEYRITNGSAVDYADIQLKVRPLYDIKTEVIKHSQRKPDGGRTAGKIRLTNKNAVPLYFRWYNMDSANQLKIRGRITVPAFDSVVISTKIRNMRYTQFLKLNGQRYFLDEGMIFRI